MKKFIPLFKITLLAFSLAVTSDALARAPKLSLQDGFYVGAAGGYDSYQAKVNSSITDADSDLMSSSAKSSVTGGVGGVFAGYGHHLRAFYLGGELFWYGTGASGTTRFSAATVPGDENIAINGTLSVSQEYGISVLPGIRVNKTSLIYLRLGVAWAKLKASDTIVSNATTLQSGSFTTTRSGFNCGIGMETAVAKHLSVRSEFNHIDYNSFTLPGPFNTTVKFSDNQYLIGLVYHV